LTNRRISVAVPVNNEEVVLPELLRRLRATLETLRGGPHEVVFVDDGSSDGSLGILQTAAEADGRIKVVVLSRNFGHQAALAAAMDFVTGDVVVVMDADLQDPPEEIERLIAVLDDGADVAYATRVRRKEGFLLRLAYAGAYRLIASLSRVRLPLDAGDYCAMSRRVVTELQRTPEHNRYMRGLRSWVGFRQIAVPIERPRRFAGESKYSAGALIRLAFDGIFAFSTIPLRVATVAGLLAIAASAGFALFAVYARLVLDRSPAGFTSVIVLMTFLSGMHLVFLGIIGEYIARVYDETKARPLYVVDQVIHAAIVEQGNQVVTHGP
jgi:polyisoprenyl-phosphate glycosyltransferase